jgi:isoleucyl-tRNA synthetase
VTKFALMLAPIVPFTADEIWENIPGEHKASVHLSEFEEGELRDHDVELIDRWRYVYLVRGRQEDGTRSVGVQSELEFARERKEIGSSLEATITINTGSDGIELLKQFSDEELQEIFIVSEVVLKEKGSGKAFSVDVRHATGEKCERCWHWSETTGKDPRVPQVDERCIRQLEGGWGL